MLLALFRTIFLSLSVSAIQWQPLNIALIVSDDLQVSPYIIGFGTIISKKSSIQSRFFAWNLSRNKQWINTPYMDFQNSATKFARKHFNCSRLQGIEAEDYRRMHLDEYIYGDELMTPKLSPYKNYFTFITAKILEQTTRNDQTNQKMVEEETRNYWYGQQWGCEFAMSSCYDYVNQKRNGNTFPFCNSKDYTRMLFTKDNSKKVCLGNRTHFIQLLVHCPIHEIFSLSSNQHPSGLQSRPLANHFSILTHTPLANFYAGLSTHRFCPLISEVASGLIVNMPNNGYPVDCNSTRIPLLLD
uniref:Leishmanolysin-like peptidase n=1 Tax=Syphacia muris TaxID=451379 RepID=A0A0N5B0X0_9BILA